MFYQQVLALKESLQWNENPYSEYTCQKEAADEVIAALDGLPTPQAAADQMNQVWQENKWATAHAKSVELMCELLTELGYADTVNAFYNGQAYHIK